MREGEEKSTMKWMKKKSESGERKKYSREIREQVTIK